jgi:hypothetical protein
MQLNIYGNCTDGADRLVRGTVMANDRATQCVLQHTVPHTAFTSAASWMPQACTHLSHMTQVINDTAAYNGAPGIVRVRAVAVALHTILNQHADGAGGRCVSQFRRGRPTQIRNNGSRQSRPSDQWPYSIRGRHGD